MPKRDPLTTAVIVCNWERTPGVWRLWVKGRREISGSGETFEVAHDALIDAIMETARDLDAVLPIVPEFDPPLPPPSFAEQFLSPELYFISGDALFELNRPAKAEVESAESRAAYLPTLFSGGVCPACNHPRGERTDVVLRVDNAPQRVDAGWVRAPFYTHIRLFSERFLDLLASRERKYFRPIQMPPRSRRRFFELCGRPDVPLVGVRELESDGLECTECGHRAIRVIHPWLREGGLHLAEFVCANDLPASQNGAFTVGFGNDLNLCVRRERWNELRARTGARGVMSQRLGVVSAADCDRSPRIRNRREKCELCAKWPEPRAVSDEKRVVFELPAVNCSSQSFTWLDEAERLGYIKYSQMTMRPAEIFSLATRADRPTRTEYVSFRCPNCWRLGWIVLSAAESKLGLYWPAGLW